MHFSTTAAEEPWRALHEVRARAQQQSARRGESGHLSCHLPPPPPPPPPLTLTFFRPGHRKISCPVYFTFHVWSVGVYLAKKMLPMNNAAHPHDDDVVVPCLGRSVWPSSLAWRAFRSTEPSRTFGSWPRPRAAALLRITLQLP